MESTRVRLQKLNPKVDRGEPLAGDDLRFVRAFMREAKWKAAKTYASWAPHTYTINPNQWGADNSGFMRLLEIINRCGYTRAFFSKRFRYLDIDGETVWVCGLGLTDSGIINRATQDPGEEPWPPTEE